ncbi:MAG: ATP-binding protein [Bacteroidetes bacterium]|nr:ATP-binding protein [Bacteroidota bacterium]
MADFTKFLSHNYSSKIKKVYIELHRYSYFHGPSEIDNIDSRFIGREKLIKRLQALLTNSGSKSGAYLVTGQRGVGKSSFVSKTIDEISSAHKPFYIFSRYLRIYFLIVLLCFFIDNFLKNTLQNEIILGCALSLFIIFSRLYFKNNDNVLLKNSNFFKNLPVYFDFILIKSNKSAKQIFSTICQDFSLIFLFFVIYQVCKIEFPAMVNPPEHHVTKQVHFMMVFLITIIPILIVLIVNLCSIVFAPKNRKMIRYLEIKCQFYFIFEFLLAVISSIYFFFFIFYRHSTISNAYCASWIKFPSLYITIAFSTYFLFKSKNLNKQYIRKHPSIREWYWLFTNLLITFKKAVQQYFNYSSRICIKINLGHDDLKEKDILVLLTKNILSKYKAHKASLRKNFTWKVLNIIVFYFICGFLFYNYFSTSVRSYLAPYSYYYLALPSQQVASSNANNITNYKSTIGLYSKKSNNLISNNYSGIDINELIHFANNHKILVPDFEDAYRHQLPPSAVDICNSFFVMKAIYQACESAQQDTIKINLLSGSNQIANASSWNAPIKYPYILKTKGKDEYIEKLLKFNNQNHQINDDSLTLKTAIFSVNKSGNRSVIYNTIQPNSANILTDYLTFSRLEKRSVLLNIFNFVDLIIIKIFELLKSIIFQFSVIISKLLIFGNFIDINYLNFAFNTNSQLYKFFPIHPDYAFIVFLFLVMFLIKLSFKLFNYGLVTHSMVIRELSNIEEQINAQITEGMNTKIEKSNTLFNFSVNRKRERSYPIADVREIEKRLISVFEMIQKIPRVYTRPDIIIIFDELDKIEPLPNNLHSDTEEPFNSNSPHYFSPDAARNRKHAILSLLSNLKYFLTTAQAKFIFIAGKEIYDASLADVSDRNYFIGSIFHDVIYIPSFLSDDSDPSFSDITSMTEEYVCQFLFPYNFKCNGIYNLSEYNRYLYSTFPELNEQNEFNKTKQEQIIARQKREKIISILQQFITYLTHSSNGAPKKITKLFEDFIENESLNGLADNEKLIVQKFKNSNAFLAFDYFEQFTIGIINYLANPIILNISNSNKKHGDRLLVATSFLLDQIFKFHKHSFSWRNIELTPELIDFSKPTELRNFITDILQFLSLTHIQEIISGLHEFRFSKKITHEISFLTKTSERASASFSFSLDESLSLKQYFRKYLVILENRYNQPSGGVDKQNYVNSISYIHMILGDLHFYDEELTEAVVEYLDSLQILRNLPKNDLNVPLMVLLVRNMLKLGYTYEKRKSYDSAYLTYGELTSLLISYRDINLSEIGLQETLVAKENNRGIIIIKDSNRAETLFEQNIEPREFDPYNDHEICYVNNSDQLKENDKIKTFLQTISRRLTPQIQDIIFKISSFEGIKLLYQPILAKFQILEKSHLDGITKENIFRLEKEFTFLIKAVKSEEKFLMQADFYGKVSDILFYKNGIIESDFPSQLLEICKNSGYYTDTEITQIRNFHCRCNNHQIHCSATIKEIIKAGSKPSCWACYFNYKGLSLLLQQIIDFDKPIDDSNLADYIKLNRGLNDKMAFQDPKAITYKILAKLLSDRGDIFFSCCVGEQSINTEFFVLFIKTLKESKTKGSTNFENVLNILSGDGSIPPSKTDLVFLNYYFSAIFFKKANEHKKYAIQLTKILYLIRTNLTTDKNLKNAITMGILDNIRDSLVNSAIKAIYNAYENIHLFEINKYKDIFSINNTGPDISLNRSSINVDITEIILVFEEIKLKCLPEIESREYLIELYKANLISPYSLNESVFNRLLNLRFKAMLNYEVFKKLFNAEKSEDMIAFDFFSSLLDLPCENDKLNSFNSLYSDFINVLNEKSANSAADSLEIFFETLEFIITDSIYCLQEIIKLCNTYSVSYILNYSFIGSTHKKLAFWSQIYYYYRKFHFILSKADKSKNGAQVHDELNKIGEYIQTKINSSINDDSLKMKIDELQEKFIEFRRISSMKANNDRIRETLGKLIEENNLPFITARYQKSEAIRNFYMSVEMHTEGKAYKNLIEFMSFNNDDFNDRQYHFSAANERFKINHKLIRGLISKLKRNHHLSDIFNAEKYSMTQLAEIPNE